MAGIFRNRPLAPGVHSRFRCLDSQVLSARPHTGKRKAAAPRARSDTWSTKQVQAVNFAAKQPLCPRLFPEPNVWSFDSALASFHRRITMWCENRQCGGASPTFCFLDMSQLVFFIGRKPHRNSFGAAMWFAAVPLLATVQTLQCAPLLASACACIDPFLLLHDGKLAVGNYMWVVSLN